MLSQNRCWLCEEVFPRGKQKKVFQVADLLEFLLNRAIQEVTNPELLTPLKSKNLRDCFFSFKQYLRIDNEGNISTEKVIEELRKNDIETWMSGLICSINPNCLEEVNYVLKDPSKKSADEQMTKRFKSAVEKKDCPPGCNCDNPWPFLA